MANEGVNQGRRRFLTGTTAVVGGIGAAFAATPFIKSWQPSERAKNAGAPVLQDISKIEPGQTLTLNDRGEAALASGVTILIHKPLAMSRASPSRTRSRPCAC